MPDQSNMPDPLDQVIQQIHMEAGNEDLGGLTPDDLDALGKSLWAWAGDIKDGKRAVRFVADADGATGKLHRSLIEATGPDMPFLVDSLLSECAAQHIEVRTLFHPIVKGGPGGNISTIQIHLPLLSAAEGKSLKQGVEATLQDVSRSVSDYGAMRDLMVDEVKRLLVAKGPEPGDKEEAIAFLQWLGNEHYVFLGAREYRFETGKDDELLSEEPIMVEGSNLGILKDEDLNVLSRDAEPLVLTPRMGKMLAKTFPLIVAKSTLKSRVHRRVYADYVGVKKFDDKGNVVGETRFLGLFTAEAYDETARSIPFIRRRVEKVVAASGATPGGHSEKALANIMETWPRDELFQTNSATLTPIMLGVLHLIGRPRTRLFTRRDPFGRFVSAIVFVPRDAYDTNTRQRIGHVLTEAYQGRLISFQPYFDTGPLARVHFQIALDPGYEEPDIGDLQQRITAIARTWDDAFRGALADSGLTGADMDGAQCFRGGFNAAYREAFSPEEALIDVREMAKLGTHTPICARAYRKAGDEDTSIRVKIYARDGAIALSRCVPVFENMGLFVKFETGYPVRPGDKPADDAPNIYWVHDLSMQTAGGEALDVDTVKALLEDAFVAVWQGEAENDGFNALVLKAEAGWREAALIRALAAYRRQSGLDAQADTQIAALLSYPDISELILQLFKTRFDPAVEQDLKQRAKACRDARADIDKALEAVSSLTDDQVLRRIADLVMACQRTNFYQRSDTGAPKPFISFKVASSNLEDLPAPKPYREIFMSSPQVEGLHLRFGPVARGGLRWSDRRDDYRTEVLGLVKAQQVKNAVIVPVGSKGGFYPKALPPRTDRDAWFEAGRDAYKQFITSLLGVTDNLEGGDVVHPADTVIWDGEDPYLVVAADKGTATFSDTANAISEAHDFWLGDAFASGGSVGYDHKKMGITARGGWEAVKRHFREMGKDIQEEPFTVIGCGDMGGDVFGNGMLLSKQIKLQAAFNHLHIFIDPDPDPAKSWDERKRLFDDVKGWDAYNTQLISKGGGVFERSAKSITLTPEIKALTGISAETVTPDALIHSLLKADTELLWFGGIGTYVRATSETDTDVGDRANDGLRVTAKELGASVIGEGANLGMTQASRIEFALNGGRLNTDAIDNSAGVDSSDHEVNIKILATEAIRSGKLKAAKRNALLAEMTDDVASHVLAHNYDQTGALSLAEVTAKTDHAANERVMVYLEKRGVLNRPLEGLPSTAEMETRRAAGKWLTRPELAVLLAWFKIVLFDDIVGSDIPDDAIYEATLKGYFPSPIDGYDTAMAAHRLKREIIGTIIANRTLDLGGPAALMRVVEDLSGDTVEAVKALEAGCEVLNIREFYDEIDALDNKVPASLQGDMRLKAVSAAAAAARWFADNMNGVPVCERVERTEGALGRFKGCLLETQSPAIASHIERVTRSFIKQGAPEDLARWAGAIEEFAEGLTVVDVAAKTGKSISEAADTFYVIGDALRLDRIRASANKGLAGANFWDRVAARRVISDLTRQQAVASVNALKVAGVEDWLSDHAAARKTLTSTLGEMSRGREWSFAKLALGADAVRRFMES